MQKHLVISGLASSAQRTYFGLCRAEVATTMVVFRNDLHGMCFLGRHVISLFDTMRGM